MQRIWQTRNVVLVVLFLICLSACGSISQPTKATPAPQQSGLTFVTTLEKGEVFVDFGTSIIIRKPDNAGSKGILLSINNGILVYGVPSSATQARLIVDMNPDAQKVYKIVNNSADFAKIYCAGRNQYPDTRPAVMNLPKQWDVTC